MSIGHFSSTSLPSCIDYIYILAKAIVGFRAQSKLLKGTSLDWAELGSNQRVFTKKGSYSNAVDDFKSVGPTNVIQYTLPGGVSITRQVDTYSKYSK